jgi:hypothetical protein
MGFFLDRVYRILRFAGGWIWGCEKIVASLARFGRDEPLFPILSIKLILSN